MDKQSSSQTHCGVCSNDIAYFCNTHQVGLCNGCLYATHIGCQVEPIANAKHIAEGMMSSKSLLARLSGYAKAFEMTLKHPYIGKQLELLTSELGSLETGFAAAVAAQEFVQLKFYEDQARAFKRKLEESEPMAQCSVHLMLRKEAESSMISDNENEERLAREFEDRLIKAREALEKDFEKKLQACKEAVRDEAEKATAKWVDEHQEEYVNQIAEQKAKVDETQQKYDVVVEERDQLAERLKVVEEESAAKLEETEQKCAKLEEQLELKNSEIQEFNDGVYNTLTYDEFGSIVNETVDNTYVWKPNPTGNTGRAQLKA